MILIKEIIDENGIKTKNCLYKCQNCNNEVVSNKYDHNKKLKNGKEFCKECTWKIAISNRTIVKKEEKIGDVKIIKHLEFKPNDKRYVIAECPLCKKHYKKRHDALKLHPLCKECNGFKGLELRTTHGLSKHNLFERWMGMKARCSGNSIKSKKYYLEKEITVCKEWEDDFMAFYNWSMENGYKKELELDKDILSDAKGIYPKIYGPETCMWITKKLNRDYAMFIKNRKNNEALQTST